MSIAKVLIFITALVASSLLDCCSAQTPRVDFVPRGFEATNLNWVDKSGQFLQSSSGSAVASFYNPRDKDGNSYYLCVSLFSTIIWTANRNSPVSQSDLFSFESNGEVKLYRGGSVVFSTGTANSDAQTLQLRDDGNLVLRDSKNVSLWESFQHPTDTWVMGQRFSPGMRLVSAKSTDDFSEGLYSLQLGSSSLELLVNLDGRSVPYWILSNDPRAIIYSDGTPPAYAILADSGLLTLYNNDSTEHSSLLLFQGGSNNTARRLVLGSDGNLDAFFNGLTNPDAILIIDKCSLPNTCGSYGICFSSGQCRCPAHLASINNNNPTQGCSVAPLDLCKNPDKPVEFLELDNNLSYFANQYSTPSPANTLDDCKSLCSKNCSCTGGFFQASTKSCYLTWSQKQGSFQFQEAGYQSFIRVPAANKTTLHTAIYVIIGCSLLVIFGLLGVFWWWYRRTRAAAMARQDEEDGFLEAIPGVATRFSYKELQTATNGFTKRLGGGSFGSVYEGVLPARTKVAVKQLENIGQGKKEFRAEVATIGSIHHVNLVRLHGFCSEGSHRLLVYEFLARGSLDKSLFSENNDAKNTVLDWDTRYNIAIGTARGLAYLHEDCRERIIHCDIKPENILLDEHFTAKVSDFGLAKLMNREQSHVFTTMRGTRGYLAPEWLYNTAISEKSDVYSFGMVLLEIVSGRKNFDPTETSEKWYIPAYAFKQVESGNVVEVLDPKLKGGANDSQVVKVVKIALWCIQEDPQLRPSTGKVLQMLEGNIGVPEPPLSSQFAVRLHARLAEAVSERERYSLSTQFNSQDLLSANYLSGPR